MGNPVLLAKRASLESFLAEYDPAVTPFFVNSGSGQTVLFGALANRDPQERVAIANRLLDDNADASVVTTSGTTLLHVLLGQREHEPRSEAALLRRLLEGGAPINTPDPRDGAPLAMLYRLSSLSHDERLPMYEVFFGRPDLDLDAPASKAHTVREQLTMAAPNVPVLQQLIDDYDARGATR